MSSTRLLQVLAIALLAGTPLVYSGAFFAPYTLVKAAYSALLGGSALLLIVRNRPRWTAMHLAFLVFLGAQILAWFFSEDRSLSLWGLAGRQDGLVRYFSLYFSFLVFDYLLRSGGNQKKLLAWFVASGSLVAITAVGTAAPGATVGNSVFLGSFLLFAVFIAAYAQKIASKKARLFMIAGCFLSLIGVIASASRGAFLGLCAGSIVWLMAKNKRLFYAGAVVFALAAAAGTVLYSKGFLDGFETLTSRFYLWKIALAGFFENPLLGWGQGAYPLLFDKFYEPALIDMVEDVKWADAPHNIFLAYLSSSGLLGAASFLGLLAVALRVIGQKIRTGKKEFAWLAACLAGYAVAGAFGIDTPELLLALVFTLALINADTPEVNFSFFNKRIMRLAYCSMVGLVAAGILVGTAWQLTLARASRVAANAIMRGDKASFDAEKNKFLSIPVLQPHLSAETAAKLKENYDGLPPVLRGTFRDDVVALLKNADAQFPVWTRYKFLLAGTLAKEAPGTPASAARSEALYLEIIATSPRRQMFYLALADLKRYQNLPAENRAYIQKAIDIYPRAIFPRVYLVLYYFTAQNLDGILKTLEGIENASPGQLEQMNEFMPKGLVIDLVRVLRASGETKYAEALDETLKRYK